MNDFVEWLDANRSANVSAIFHDTVAQFEQLRTTVAEQQKRIAELEEALKNHQEQTRPIEHTINVLKQIRQPGKSVAPFLVAYKEQLTTAQAQIKVLREAAENLIKVMSGTQAETDFAFQMFMLEDALRDEVTK